MKTRRHRGRPWLGPALLSLALGGCSSLLPTAKKEVVSAWTTYDEATASLSLVEPYKATRADVHRQGLDPRANPPGWG